MIRVAIADDHPVFREGLRKAIATARDIVLAGEARDGHEALQLCTREKPDLLVVDLAMPRCDGFGVLEQLFRVSPKTRALVLTAHATRAFEERSLAAGASGFLQKDSSVATILKAMRAVSAGEVWASRIGASNVLSSRSRRKSSSVLPALTKREEEILILLGQGMRNREIARQTGVSEKTIATHLVNLTEKLGVRSRLEAALLGRKYASPKRAGENGDGRSV